MRDANGQNERERRDRDEWRSDDPLAGYTLKQREAFLKGFRILADVAIRAHIERQALPSSEEDAEPQKAEEEG